MRRPPVEQLRRLMLAGAVLVALVLAGSYGVRRWRASQARRTVPTVVPVAVQQQAEKFTLSRSEQGRTLFTVQASRTIELAGRSTVLQEVTAVIYGRRGERADEIRTGRCEYDVGGTGEIHCPGEVTMTLGSRGAPGARSIRLTTSGVRFDTVRGAAWTDQPVRFRFPEGTGEGVGLRYQTQEPAVRLERRVSIEIARGADPPVQIQGARLDYYAGSQVLELLPPLSLRLEERTLVADRVRLEMDESFRARRVEALGGVQARALQEGRELSLRAPRAVALYALDGGIQQLQASEGVEFLGGNSESQETLTCREAVFDFDASHRLLERVRATGTAELRVRTAEETRELRAPVLEFAPAAGRRRQLLRATGRGTLVVKRPEGDERTLTADRIELEFQQKQRLQALVASGNVETQLARPDAAPQTTASDELRARFDEQGTLAEAEQWGRFRFRSQRSRAEAGRARYWSASETSLLRSPDSGEQPVVWDATTRTSAHTIEWREKTGSVRAEGEVRTTHRPAPADGQGLPPPAGLPAPAGFGSGEPDSGEPVHWAAERLRAERERGWARYEGRARMWEGENRLSAAAIELFRDRGKLVAEGDVSGLFFEAPGEKPNGEPPARRRAITVASERFTYLEAERRGLFEENVKARNEFGTLWAPRLEVFLAAAGGRGSQSVERAHAEGGVRIEQAGRQAVSEQADYRADAQTVVLSGGAPTVVDVRRGTTTGAQLTLFLADGTILVTSGEGKRAITRRPWTE